MHQEKIHDLLNLGTEEEYNIVAKKYQQCREDFMLRKEKSQDIRTRIRYQNKVIELDDAFLLYQKNKLLSR